MNKWKMIIKRNWLAGIIAIAIIATCLALLYYKHPASPYFKHDTYVLRYEQIGTLSPGNLVRVNGIPHGQIKKVQLTEDAVFVTIEVEKGTKIQKNSAFRLINSGLMGEREVAIQLGESSEFLADGDTANGAYDEGTSGISRKLVVILDDLDASITTAMANLDSLIGGSNAKRIARIQKKTDKLLNDLNTFYDENVGEARTQIQNITDALEKVKGTLENVKNKGGVAIENIDALLQKANSALENATNLKNEVVEISKKADRTLSDYKDVENKIDDLAKTIENLSKSLKKNGLNVNIDIF